MIVPDARQWVEFRDSSTPHKVISKTISPFECETEYICEEDGVKMVKRKKACMTEIHMIIDDIEKLNWQLEEQRRADESIGKS